MRSRIRRRRLRPAPARGRPRFCIFSRRCQGGRFLPANVTPQPRGCRPGSRVGWRRWFADCFLPVSPISPLIRRSPAFFCGFHRFRVDDERLTVCTQVARFVNPRSQHGCAAFVVSREQQSHPGHSNKEESKNRPFDHDLAFGHLSRALWAFHVVSQRTSRVSVGWTVRGTPVSWTLWLESESRSPRIKGHRCLF